MKEKIEEILNDENLDTEEKASKLTKELALLVIPKDKYNKLSERLDKVEAEKDELQTKYDALEKQSMTEEELKNKELADLEKERKELSLETSRNKAERLFEKAGLDEKQIESLLEKVVSEDKDKTVDLANSFIEILKVKSDETKKQIETDLLTGTHKPDFKPSGNQPKKVTLDDFKNMPYGEKKQLYATDPDAYNELIKQI